MRRDTMPALKKLRGRYFLVLLAMCGLVSSSVPQLSVAGVFLVYRLVSRSR